MPDPEFVIVPLSRPISVIDQTFTELKVREPTGADLMRAGDPNDSYVFLCRVGAACGNLPLEAIEKMRARDVIALTRTISDFLGDTPLAGSGTSTSKSPDGGETPLSSS